MGKPNPVQDGARTATAAGRLALMVGIVAALAAAALGVSGLAGPPPAGAAVASGPVVSEYPAGIGASAGNGAAPQEMALGADGDLWYTDEVSGVFGFSPAALQALPCPSSPGCQVSANAVAPTGIVTGPDGALWFTQSAGGNPGDGRSYFPAAIGRLTTAGAYRSYPVPSSGRAVPGLDAITAGPNGELWFTESALDRIGELDPAAATPTVQEHPLPAGNRLGTGVGSSVTSADTIAAGPDQTVWFTEQGSNAIGVMSSTGSLLSKFVLPDAHLNPTPLGIAQGPGGTMWFAENAANQIGRITAQGQITLYPLPAAAAGPGSVIYGPGGDLWFTDDTGVAAINPATGQVDVYRAAGANPGPVGIAVGPGCTSIWFTEPSTDRLGRVSPLPATAGCPTGRPSSTSPAPLTFAPSPLALGDVVVGGGGAEAKLTVANQSAGPLTLGALKAGDFVGQIAFATDLSASTCRTGSGPATYNISGQTTTTAPAPPATVLGPGQECYFRAEFTARALGPVGLTLSLASTNAAGVAQADATVAVTATGVGPLAFSPSPLALGNVIVGGSGVRFELTLTNNLARPAIGLVKRSAPAPGSLTLGRLKVGAFIGKVSLATDLVTSTCHPGAGAAGYNISGPTTTTASPSSPGTVLGPGQQCDLWAIFTAKSLGPVGLTLSLGSTTAAGAAAPAATVLITADGIAPLSLSPSPVDLGDVTVGGTGTGFKLTVTNGLAKVIGPKHPNSITLARLSAAGYLGKVSFTIEPSSSCRTPTSPAIYRLNGQTTTTTAAPSSPATVLGPGQHCYFWVVLTARSLGPTGFTLSLSSTNTAGGAEPDATDVVTATGVAPLRFSPSPVALGHVTVDAGVGVTLTVTNGSSRSLTLGPLRAGDFVGKVAFATDLTASTCHTGSGSASYNVVGQTTTTAPAAAPASTATVLRPGHQCIFVGTFTARSPGPAGLTLSLSSNGPRGTTGPTATVVVTATATAAKTT